MLPELDRRLVVLGEARQETAPCQYEGILYRGSLRLDFRIFVPLYCAMRVRLVAWAVAFLATLPGPLWAVEAAPTISDREIVERLTRIETRLDSLETRLDAFQADMDSRFEQLSTRISDLLWIFIGVMGFFGVIIAALLTLVVRDRKAPVHLAERDAESLRDIRLQMDTIRDILRDFGEINPDFAAILKRRPTL